jgi:dienelactone hydrolase
MTKTMLSLTALFLFASAVHAEVKSKTVTYKHGDTTLKGYLAWDDKTQGKRPGVLVVHEWWGLNDYTRKRAEQLAELGYVAFAADIFGNGKVTEHPKEASEWAGMMRKNVAEWEGRARAGLKILQDHERVDSSKLAAIGYCFGGSTAMQLAYTGADLKAVVTFHGGLMPPSEEQTKAVKAKVLICHGAEDPFIKEETLQAVRKAFEVGGLDYQMIYYANAEHSFTVPGIDKVGVKGLAYDPGADARSWQHMRMLFAEAFAEKK